MPITPVRSRLAALAAISLAACLFAVPALAGKRDAAKLPDNILSVEEILSKVRQDKPGRVVEVDLDRRGNRHIYEVEVIDENGVEWDLEYDARTGELLRSERDDD